MAALRDLVAEELAEPVDPRVRTMAEAIAAKHAPASRAVLFYGSCLRQKQLEGLMLDFYRLNGPETRNVSVWARFAQPSRLVWAADDASRAAAIAAISRSAPTLLASAGRVEGEAPLDWWRRAFSLTYSAELRAERKGRSTSVVDADLERYQRFSGPAIAAIPALMARPSSWARRRVEGKMLSVVRLAKASATFAGGVDYIAWKINRHAGTEIDIKPWQRRWPLLAAISLLPRLLRSGAVR